MSSAESGKREIIMKAAIKVFAAKGYHSCRTLDISKEAGVAYGSLYQYFKSKDDILLSIYRDNRNYLLRRMEILNQTKDSPALRISKIFDFIFANYEHNPDLIKVMIMEVPKLSNFYEKDNQELFFRFFAGLAEIIAEGQKKGLLNREISPIIASFVIYGAADNTIRQYVFNPDFGKQHFPMNEAKNQIIKFFIPGYLIKK
jgi:TetR/AcrR family transcriptional regulator, fatty acid metabolism regulator protein